MRRQSGPRPVPAPCWKSTGGAAHVPQVLYYWRVHAGSTSGGTDAKPYVAAAAKKALADHLARTGRTGTVEDGLFPSTYRVKWDIVGDPKVSILIPNKDHTGDLGKVPAQHLDQNQLGEL